MFTTTQIYLSAALVLLIATIPFSAIIFFISVLLSVILGFILFLDRKLPEIENDYAVFKENRPIHFIERDRYWNHMTEDIERKISLVPKFEFNKKFTSDTNIDTQLNEVIELAFQDFVQPWHQSISLSQEFPNKLYLFVNYTVSAFARRLKEVDVSSLLTSKVLDEFIKHNRLYRLTRNRLASREYTEEEFITTFFENERKLEKNFNRERLCRDNLQLVHFIDHICDVLQYILFPYNSFNNETFRLFTKGILTQTILTPILDLLSEPDFINGIIIGVCKSHLPSTDTFMAVLQSVDDVNEIRAVLESVETEIKFVRSKDDNDGEMKMKQQLGSLLFLKKIILSQLKKFEEFEESKSLSDSLNEEEAKEAESPELALITFDAVLRHSIALEYFTEYMATINACSYINFFINVEAFKISVEQGLFEIYLSSLGNGASEEQCHQLKQLVLEAAMNIYETYLSPLAPNRLALIEQSYCDKLRDQLSSNDSSTWMTEGLFDEIFAQVRSIILKHDQFFPAFKRNKHYLKLLLETDLVRGQLEAAASNAVSSNVPASKSVDDLSEIDSIDSHVGEEGVKGLKCFDESDHHEKADDGRRAEETGDKADFASGFTVEISETGKLTDHGKTFVAYLINVAKCSTGEKWVILRRYSEFYTLHQLMIDKCEKYHFNLKNILSLPPKSFLSNRNNRNFVEYRKYMLNIYLKKLSFLYERFNYLRDDIYLFLHPGNYNCKEPGRLERTVSRNGRSFNPIKTIGNAMKNGSENLLDGFQKLSRTLSLQQDVAQPRMPEKKTMNNSQSNSLNVKHMPAVSGSGSANRSPVHEETNFGFTVSSVKNQQQQQQSESADELSLDSASFENDENIPLLSLLDEIFDLKNQNFWFRRRLIDLFKQIIEATYSDMINKKICDYIDLWTSPSAIAEYIESLKQSFWPNGKLAYSSPRKNEELLRRKVAAKALILTRLSESLKKVVGSETTQNGLISFFELFQIKTLNQRLVLVLFELLLKEIFPHNYFEEIFARLYASIDTKSTRSTTSSGSTADWPPHLSKFIARI